MGQIINNPPGGVSNIDGVSLDNAGRLEVSNFIATGEYVLDKDNRPLFFDAVNVDGGVQGYTAATNSQDFSGDGLSGAIFQTKQRHPYFPGAPQQAEFTTFKFAAEESIIKRVGYFSSSIVSPYTADFDGIYLEAETDGLTHSLNIANSGTITRIPHTSWLDPLDGTGPSGITTNWNNFQVFLIDFLYLGGTYVNLYYIAEGKRHLVHRYDHANNAANTIMANPAQPIRAEHREVGEVGAFSFVCAQVSTMGSQANFSGVPFAVDTGAALVAAATSGTKYVAFGVRKNNRAAEFFPTDLSLSSTAGTGAAFLWTLEINPTLSGALTYGAVANTYMDLGPAGGVTVTAPGHVVACGTGVGRSEISINNISKALRIGQTVAGVYDQMVLTFTPLSNNQDFAAALVGVVV